MSDVRCYREWPQADPAGYVAPFTHVRLSDTWGAVSKGVTPVEPTPPDRIRRSRSSAIESELGILPGRNRANYR